MKFKLNSAGLVPRESLIICALLRFRHRLWAISRGDDAASQDSVDGPVMGRGIRELVQFIAHRAPRRSSASFPNEPTSNSTAVQNGSEPLVQDAGQATASQRSTWEMSNRQGRIRPNSQEHSPAPYHYRLLWQVIL
jgi:hypothetical protein